MKISDLYKKYDIMPQLAEHQLRVGGVAKIITNEWQDRQLAHESVIACLVHDMGNIVKFKGLEHPKWIEVQKKYRALYGEDAHDATKGILLDAHLEKYAEIIEEEKDLYEQTPIEMGTFENASKPAVMVLYADLRVTPQSVVSIQERTDDLIERYKNKRTEMLYGPPTERYIQTLTNIEVDKISESDVRPLFDELLTLEI